jgi:hypothetical protein
MENIVYTLLLILHNIALVGCAAAPFYNLRLVNQRGQFGQKLFYNLDKVVEDTIQGLEPYCWSFIFVLFTTGFGFPITHFAFHGTLKEFNVIVFSAFVLKHIFVVGIVSLAFYITFFINPKIKEVFSAFSSDESPDVNKVKIFFNLRAKRKKLCKICFVFALLILIVSPILRFY